ncbi:MAG: hypothetical protein A2350_05295 [Candidatus Raymondbacteria bacterium RifOxyB12_full_50_8]|uniref:ATPase n=1 Tax=Candidatus Raymondbacteria bacterium RIFOXYD12_FULL_49_13 TaxID=1817890 RepID=A0A1F7FH88_UNCRA|nr:MAG: hypothetical protein A2248_04995 [Candidatus Raymondbacteria bacterium RIFOXYA2_FULL_49_16]OGJ99260.1 MAG: hypothetical protein A2350_05295 [Candidatus Raymondbacteria bacterium RifOxyB12_full_50_8]OGK05852.1 MAG: hypothetical protein A2519_04170 [Candidatus Raymondbacteria bacterium RIFOXYD12_FULL_49_13]OGP43346.1 MAG: hypothetical protein A2324_02635 [Candidatus Raymondbacteria bacterium RIFOXYB2_FULL_49_35]
MRTILHRLIADFQERVLPSGIDRDRAVPMLAGKTDAIIGMRRSGKTFLCYQAIAACMKRGIEKSRILYFNFEDERLLPLQSSQLTYIPELFYENNPAHKNRKCYFFFDEIQRIPGWELFVRRLMDAENMHCVITGSSARLLGREIATALRGRSLPVEVFPFSFKEYLRFHKSLPENYRNPGAASRAVLQKALSGYLWRGGFPEAQNLTEEFRIKLLQGYVDVVLFRDVVERHPSVNIEAIRSLIRQASASVTGYFSINKFYHALRSAGISCTKNSLYEYVSLLEDAFFFFTVPICSKSERIQRVNPRKLYLSDTGLITAMTSRIDADSGMLLENLVFCHLRRDGQTIEYYQTKNGGAVDFIARSSDGRLSLIQVCADMMAVQARAREIAALEEAMKETGIRNSAIVTLRDRETIKTGKGTIHVYPAWEYILQ